MRISRSVLMTLGFAVFASPACAGDAQVYKVELNKTEIVRLSGAASTIIIGNPKIADVTVQSANTIFVVGRGYGETNLIILDAQGNTMMNADLQVVNTLPAHGVRLYNAKERETYSCIPYCGPSPVLGDSAGFVNANTSNAPQIGATVANAASFGSDEMQGENGTLETSAGLPSDSVPQRNF